MLTKSQALLNVAMEAPEQFVAAIKYLDSRGNVTERIVSPIRYLTPRLVSVYCLGREAPRSLRISGMLQVRLKITSDVLAPEAIRNLVQQRSADSHQKRATR